MSLQSGGQRMVRGLVVLAVVSSWMAVALWGALPSGPVTQAQTASSEVPRRVFLHSETAPNPALNRPVARLAGLPQDEKGIALSFVEGQRQAAIQASQQLSWRVERSEPLDAGRNLVRVIQTKDGIPVFGAALAVQVAGDRVLSTAGSYLSDITVDSKARLSVADAFKAAATLLAGRKDSTDGMRQPVLTSHELVFFNGAMFDAGPATTLLAYQLVVDDADGSDSFTLLVHADSGKILLVFPNYERERRRVIYNAQNTRNDNIATLQKCYDNERAVGTPNAECRAVFETMGTAYDYFSATFGRDSYDGRGATLNVVAFYNEQNAYWSGGTHFTFGTGFAVRDIAGHELTHAVIQYTADLVYANQSGALNEGIADVFGAMIDTSDWLLGEDSSIGALRDMANPPRFGNPDRMSQFNCLPNTRDGDWGGVHINSGVINKLVYLMAAGDTFNGRTVTGMGRDASAKVFYRALTTYLTANSTFADLDRGLVAAATDLYGAGSQQLATVQAASAAVELGAPLPCGGGPTPDSFEPDNSPASAQQIATDGTAQRHTFHVAGDVDFVRFNATARATYVIETLNLGSNADTVLTLSDSTGNQLAEDDDGGGRPASKISWTAPANGTYIVRVRDYNANAAGANSGYDLRITGSAPPSVQDAFEPDDSQGAAKPITVGGAAQDHNFHVGGDQDWVSFGAVAGGQYVIETLDLGPTSDTVLSLHDGQGNEITSDDDGGGGRASRIVWTSQNNASYFVRVRHYSQDESGASTSYRLRITATLPAGDSFEIDNSSEQAQPIEINGTSQSHTIHVPGDQDWVRFDVAAGRAIVVKTSNLSSGTDTVLTLFDGAGNQLDQNDDDVGLASRVSYVTQGAGTLYARVVHYDTAAGNDRLSYKIRVTSSAGISSSDTFEPDNSAAQARTFTPNSPAETHTFHISGDEDWLSFATVPGNTYTIETANLGARSDTIIELLAADGTTVIQSDDDGGTGLGSRIVWIAPDGGTYFVRIYAYGDASGEETNYDVTIASVGTSGAPDAFEPDDSAAAAKPMAVNGPKQPHTFHQAGDSDWVSFQATAGISYTIATLDLGTRSDTTLTLYDSSAATVLAENDDFNGFAAQLGWAAPADGTYLVKVSHYDPNIGGANTDYTLRLTSSQPDAFEPDDSADQAKPLPADGTRQNHTFHTVGDQDWVTFSATAGTIYVLETDSLGDCADTVLSLYTNGNLVADNDDFGGLRSRIAFRPSADAVYTAQVRNYDPEAAGGCASYELSLSSSVSGDAFEPDDRPADASTITVDGPAQTHTIHIAGDEDWASFNATANTIYTIATSNLGACADTVLRLYDENNNLLAFSDDVGTDKAARVEWAAPLDGTYFIRVFDYDQAVAGDCTAYNLAVTTGGTLVPDSFEPDNSAAEAKPIAIDAPAQQHTFHLAGDQDWVIFTPTVGLTYTINTLDLGANADTVLALFDGAGTLLEENDDVADGNRASQIVWQAPDSNSYSIKVTGYANGGGVPDANYSLQVVTGTPPAAIQSQAAAKSKEAAARDLPSAAPGALRLSGVRVEGSVRAGEEFTTLVLAQGSAAGYKLVADAQSDQLELVAIRPLNGRGGDVAGAHLWRAQQAGRFDMTFSAAWSTTTSQPLVELRWRVRQAVGGSQLRLPVRLIGRGESGEIWNGGIVTFQAQVLNSVLKIQSVSPTTISLAEGGKLFVNVTGLNEVPRVFLVDAGNSYQLTDVRFAPETTNILIVDVPRFTKAGTYKVVVEIADGSNAVSDETVTLQGVDAPVPTATLEPTAKPIPPTPTTGPSVDPRKTIYLPFIVR